MATAVRLVDDMLADLNQLIEWPHRSTRNAVDADDILRPIGGHRENAGLQC